MQHAKKEFLFFSEAKLWSGHDFKRQICSSINRKMVFLRASAKRTISPTYIFFANPYSYVQMVIMVMKC